MTCNRYLLFALYSCGPNMLVGTVAAAYSGLGCIAAKTELAAANQSPQVTEELNKIYMEHLKNFTLSLKSIVPIVGPIWAFHTKGALL